MDKTDDIRMWTIMILLLPYQLIQGTQVKRGAYSVQEMNQEFSSPGASDSGNYPSWASPDTSSYSSAEGGSSSHYGGKAMSFMTGGFPGGYHSSYGSHGPYSGGGGGGGGGKYGDESGFTAIQGDVIDDHHPPSIFEYKPPNHGKDINDLPHILPPGGKSIEQLQEEADFHFKKLLFDTKVNQKSVQDKIRKLKENYGYGTFGYGGYKNTIKYEPIDLGTHKAIDLGSSIDYTELKAHHPGKLKLPVQTVTVTKTLGIHVPEPYPVKQEIAVPAPYPVPQPVPVPHPVSIHHSQYGGGSGYSAGHEIISQHAGSYPVEYSSGKSSYPPSSMSKLIRYHENLPKSSSKTYPQSYKSSSQSYTSYQTPSRTYQEHSSNSYSPSESHHFLMPPPVSSTPYGHGSHHYSS